MVKAPIVPSSYVSDRYRPTAQFLDPESGETMQITGIQHPEESEKLAYIAKPDKEGGKGVRSQVHLSQRNSGNWSSEMTQTAEEYRHRGYAKALYDFLAKLVHDFEGGNRIVPGNQMLRDGERFWEASRHSGASDDWKWRVRDDL